MTNHTNCWLNLQINTMFFCHSFTANQNDEEKCKTLISSCERLVHPEQMGEIYKVVSITSKGVSPIVFNHTAVEEEFTGRSTVSVTDNSAPAPKPAADPSSSRIKPVDRQGN